MDREPVSKNLKIGPFATYFSEPPTSKEPKTAAIVVFYDGSGSGTSSAKELTDTIVARTGIPVFCPDIFTGDKSHEGILSKVQGVFKKLHPSVHTSSVEEFIKMLKLEHSVVRLGAVGYSSGAKFAVHCNSTGELFASVACHPEHVSLDEIMAVTAPISFICAEHDDTFSHSLQKSAKEILDQRVQEMHPTGARTNMGAGVEATVSQEPQRRVPLRRDFESRFVVIPNTTHGFAVHPDMYSPDGRTAFENALSETCTFLEKHLLVRAPS